MLLPPGDPFDSAQPHRCGPRVLLDLGLVGPLGPAGDQAQLRLHLVGYDGQVDRRLRTGAVDERLLDQPVLEGVVALHHDPSADRDRVQGGRDGPTKNAELVVDLDPERLEGALRRVSAGTAGRRRDHVVEQLDQAGRVGERGRLTLADDRAGDLLGELLLAVRAQDPGQVGSAVGVQHVCGGQAGGVVHPHVQRGVLGVGETACADVELHRGDAEVEEDPLHRGHAQVGQDLGDLVVDRVHQRGALSERLEPAPGEFESVDVAVDPDDVRFGAPGQDRLGVATETEGRVDQDAAGLRESGGQ